MRFSRRIAAAACAALLLPIAACTDSVDDPQVGTYAGAYLYGTDGNMANEFGDSFAEQPGLLAGMKGTTPMVELSAEFLQQLRGVVPNLKDFTYAGEAYDAVVISALAAELAGTTDPKVVATYINGVTTGTAPCRTIVACLTEARKGRDVAYRGVTLRHGFTDLGEPATASYATRHFDSTNQIDNGRTEYLNTGNETNVTAKAPPLPASISAKSSYQGDPLTIGSLLPRSGTLSYISAPMIAGAKLAVSQVNAAGGVLGKNVKWLDGDDGTSSLTKAVATIRAHHAAGVQILLGTGASGLAMAAMPEAIKEKMIMFSPSNTSAALTKIQDEGLYFRTAPSDILQARALADVMLRDGVQRVAIVAHSAGYGTGLQEDVRKELVAAGLSTADVQLQVYAVGDDGGIKDKNELVQIAQQVAAFKPDGVLVIGYGESAEAIKALAQAGLLVRH